MAGEGLDAAISANVEQNQMREHLEKCLSSGQIERFPQKSNKHSSGIPAHEIIDLCCTCNRPEKWRETIGCDSCEMSYHLPCVNLTTIPRVEMWSCEACVVGSCTETTNDADSDRINETKELHRGSVKRKQNEGNNKIDKDKFRQFLNENLNEMLEVMKNVGMPKASAPLKSFFNSDNQELVKALEVSDALELIEDFFNSRREFRSYLRTGPLVYARFEKVFG